MLRLIPSELHFFDVLESQAEIVVKAARLMVETFESGASHDGLYTASVRIHELEHQGDSLTHELLDRLNKTFITPIDREDIFALTCRLDDVVDFVDAVAKRAVTFRISGPTPYAVELSRIVLTASEEVAQGVRLLRDLRRAEAIVKQCARINQLENDADQVLRDALNDLFNGPARDPLDVIKWKDLYEHLEGATDRCEDVANVLETVLVKYS
jgi:hypothetical protein